MIDTVDLYRYELSLTNSLSLSDTTLAVREGLLLRVELEEGAIGWGDAAPLPGFSTETLDTAVDAGRQLASDLTGLEGSDGPPLDVVARDLVETPPLPPSVRFAAESALLEARAKVSGLSPTDVLRENYPDVSLNALLAADTPDLAARARELRRNGYRAVKLKVGRRSLDGDIERVRTVRDALGEDAALRLDANRAWSFEEAVTFADQLRDDAVAYVEEPLSEPERIPEFVRQTDLSVALDETTRNLDPDALSDVPVRAVVLKPTLLGGIAATRAWVQAAQKHAVIPVMSAAYESGVGMRMLFVLATWTPVSAGLSTYARLAEDVLVPRLNVPRPVVSLEDVFSGRVEETRLTSA